MIKNIVDYLNNTAEEFPDKTAYVDSERSVTFGELKKNAFSIATHLVSRLKVGEPVVVYIDKSISCIEGFLGTAYANDFYVPIDTAMPDDRVKLILDTLEAKVILISTKNEVPEFMAGGSYELIDIEAVRDNADEDQRDTVLSRQYHAIDMDPAYAIFTSGSTGVPKGVLVSQRSVINFTEWWCETFEFSDSEVFANQTPFYFDASVKDIYATLRCGATMYIVPKKLFSQPVKLVNFLNDNKVNCIDWVPSVLCMIVNFRTFEKIKPLYLKKIMFLGEVMPTKQFNMWRRELPDIKYANLYGPTEATGDCTYYKLVRQFADDEPIPIGGACENTDVMLLNEKDKLVGEGEIGEICVRGCSLALGYFNDPEKTDAVFVQNPYQTKYRERIYRTGDLGKYNEYGEIVFLSRKDAQIKHMGHRIELGEIETAISAVEGVQRVCCMYDHDKQKIIAIYEGSIEKKNLIDSVKQKVPQYMVPQILITVDAMPINLNGKIDRARIKQLYLNN